MRVWLSIHFWGVVPFIIRGVARCPLFGSTIVLKHARLDFAAVRSREASASWRLVLH